MQILVILPVVCFLFLFAQGIAYKGAAFLLLLLLFVNGYRYIRDLRMFQYPVLALLVGSFLLYAFYGLGAIRTPQTFQTIKESNSVALFDFSKQVKIDKICYYVGIDKNVNFVLEAMQKNRWKQFYTYEKSFPFSFRWKCINRPIETSKILLRVTKNEMMLNEIRFIYQDKPLFYKSSVNFVNDEPKAKIDTSYYSGMFFDEIYFGRTAYEIMRNKNVYENTHPYLGKLLMIPGIKLFGMSPFGWRFMNVIFAGILIFMAYYFALHLFREKIYAFSAAYLMTYSFMHLAQSRIGLIDTFGVLFVFISYFYLYRFIVKQQLSRLLVSGVFFGLAAAVKWSAMFASVGFVLIALYLFLSRYPLQKRFSGVKLLLYGLLSYGVVALGVYSLTFFDIYAQTGSLQSIINYNTNMYHYHSTLQATHPYSSDWWSWPLDMKPMGYYKQVEQGLLSSINVFGNPAVFWVGIIAILYLLFVSIKRATLEAWFILLAFLGLYLPYIFVGRLMFIYHFYYAVPFMMLAIVYMIRDGAQKIPLLQSLNMFYLAVVAGLFLVFYPVLSGYGVDQSYVSDWLKWFATWWF